MPSPPSYQLLTPSAVGALAALRLVATPESMVALFTRLPASSDQPILSQMRDVDSGLLNLEPSGAWLFTPHGGGGVTQALRQALANAGFVENGPNSDAEGEIWGLLAKVPSRGQAEAALALANAGGDLNDAELERELCHLPSVFLMGPPNAGKSTLFNALAGDREVIVSEVAGTTRDSIEGRWHLGAGFEVRLFDSPGMRAAPSSASEAAGIGLLEALRREADLIIWLSELGRDDAPTFADLIVHTKADLGLASGAGADLALSAHSGAGLPALAALVKAKLFPKLSAGGDGGRA